MERSFENVIELLGKTPEDLVFKNVVLAPEAKVEVFIDNERRKDYLFDGIILTFRKKIGCFTDVYFDGKVRKKIEINYQGGFPCGVQFGDSIDAVKYKLREKNVSIPWPGQLNYELPNVRLVFHFDKADALRLVSGHYDEVSTGSRRSADLCEPSKTLETD